MARFIDMLTPQALDEDLTSLNISGIGPEEADDFLEKSFWESPEEAQISAGQQNFKEPEKAEPLAKSITAAKESGQPGGIGIVPAIFAGLAGAFSDNGVATTSKLMKEWDPRTHAAQAVKDETARLGMEAKRGEVSDAATARQRAEMERDAGSDVSKQWQTLLAPMSKRLGVDVSSMSASQIKEAFPVLSKQLQAQVDENYQQAMLQQSKDRLERERLKSEEKMAFDKEKEATKQAQYKTPGQKAVDQAFGKEYNEWTTAGRGSYQKEKAALDSALVELKAAKDEVFGTTSGNIAGRLPDWMRTADARNIQQKVEQAAVGMLRATLGSAFTEKEGERIMKLAYDPTLEPEKNIEKVKAAIDEMEARKNALESKVKWWEGEGKESLSGWSGEAKTSNMVRMQRPDGTIVNVPAENVEAAKARGGKVL